MKKYKFLVSTNEGGIFINEGDVLPGNKTNAQDMVTFVKDGKQVTIPRMASENIINYEEYKQPEQNLKSGIVVGAILVLAYVLYKNLK